MTTGKGDLAWAPFLVPAAPGLIKNFYFGDLNQARSMVSWDHVRKPAQKRRPFPMTIKTAAQRGTAVSVKSLAITAICLVLVYVFTAVVNIRLPFAPNGGLIHLGNVPLFVAAILFGKRTGMIAGGIGMALFDLLSGWTLWAPFTLVIVGCMGFVVGAVTEKKKSFPFYLLALLLACAIKIGGYYLAEAVIYQNWVVPLTSIPGNLIQVGAAAIITLVVIEPLRLAACHTILRK